MSGFVTSGGKSIPSDLPPGDIDLKTNLSEGEIKALTKTDCTAWRDSRVGKHTSRWYNFISEKYVGNYRNLVFAQPAKDWEIRSYKADSTYFNFSRKRVFWVEISGDLSDSWVAVYKYYFLALKESRGATSRSPRSNARGIASGAVSRLEILALSD